MRSATFFFMLCLLLSIDSNAQHRVNKRIFPVIRDRQLKYEYIGDLHCNRMVVRNLAGKYGYVDSNMKEVVSCVYDKAWFFCNNMGLVETGDKKGIIDTMGKLLLPCIYDKIESVRLSDHQWGVPITCYIERYAIVSQDTSVWIFDIHTQQFVDMHQAKVDGDFYDTRYYKITKNGLFGISLENGNEVLPAVYDHIGSLKDGRVSGVKGGKWGYWDASYKEVIAFEYDAVKDFSEGFAAVFKNKKWGYINSQGKMVADLCFEKAGDFHNHIAKVRDNNKYGLIDTAGGIVLSCIYDDIYVAGCAMDKDNLKPSIIPVQQKKKWAFVDSVGRLLTQYRYDQINNYYSSIYLVKESGFYGFIKYNFRDTTPVIYSDVQQDYRHGCLMVCSEGKWGAIDTTFKEVLPFKFDSRFVVEDSLQKNDNTDPYRYRDTTLPGYAGVSEFVNKRAIVRNAAGRYGYVNKRGKEVIPCIYSNVHPFVRGYAVVCVGKEWALIDKKGKYLILPQKARLSDTRGFIVTEQHGKYGIVDKRGNEIVPAIYDDADCYSRNLFYVRKDSVCGFVDRKGKVKLPFIYSEVSLGQLLCVKEGGQYKIINRKGKLVRVLDTVYKFVGAYYNGRMCVQDTSGRFGFVNKRGRLVIPCVYKYLANFVEGGAIVRMDVSNKNTKFDSSAEDSRTVERQGVVNTRGKEIIPIQYEVICEYSRRHLIPIMKDEYRGAITFINNKNKMVIPYISNSGSLSSWRSDGRWSSINYNGKWMYVNKRGKVKLELEKTKL